MTITSPTACIDQITADMLDRWAAGGITAAEAARSRLLAAATSTDWTPQDRELPRPLAAAAKLPALAYDVVEATVRASCWGRAAAAYRRHQTLPADRSATCRVRYSLPPGPGLLTPGEALHSVAADLTADLLRTAESLGNFSSSEPSARETQRRSHTARVRWVREACEILQYGPGTLAESSGWTTR